MKKKDMEKLFRKLNLSVRTTSHVYGWLMVDQKKILRVHYSHGNDEIPERILNKIRGQLKLNKENFKNLVECTLDLKGYLDILGEKGYL